MRKLNLIPLLIIPLLSTGYVLREGIIENPWFGKLPTSDQLPRIETFDIRSEHTGAEYRVQVQCPIGYAPEGPAYPVLYVLDQRATLATFDEVWAPLLKRRQVPDIVVVYVNFAVNRQLEFMKALRSSSGSTGTEGHSRADDFSYYVNPDNENDGGKADQFTKFLEFELFPKIDGKYHTDPEDRAIAGVGMGGLYAISVAFRAPDLFQRVLSIAPQSLYADFALIDDLHDRGATRTSVLPTRMFVGIGEDDYAERLEAFYMLRGVLEDSAASNLTIQTQVLRGRTARDIVYPASRAGLKYLYAE